MIWVRPGVTTERQEEMPRTRKTITLSLPPEMDEQVRRFIEEEDRTMSEFLREAIRLYLDDQQWLRTQRRQRAEARRSRRAAGGGPTDE